MNKKLTKLLIKATDYELEDMANYNILPGWISTKLTWREQDEIRLLARQLKINELIVEQEYRTMRFGYE